MLQEQEDRGEHELYYFDESGFSQSSSVPYAWSAIGKPWEVTAYSHSHRLNVLGFVSRKGKLVYHTTTESVTTETVIEAFDQFVAQKNPRYLRRGGAGQCQFVSLQGVQAQDSELDAHRVQLFHLCAYSPELNLIEILWRQVKYFGLPLEANLLFDRLCDEFHRLLQGLRHGTHD